MGPMSMGQTQGVSPGAVRSASLGINSLGLDKITSYCYCRRRSKNCFNGRQVSLFKVFTKLTSLTGNGITEKTLYKIFDQAAATFERKYTERASEHLSECIKDSVAELSKIYFPAPSAPLNTANLHPVSDIAVSWSCQSDKQ